MKIKRLFSALLAMSILAGTLTAECSAAGFARSKTYLSGLFTDVAADVWYADSVKNTYELGLMNGTSENTFSPSGMFTLAEAVTVAARMHNIHNGGDGKIPAAAGEWYQGAIDYCTDNGIITKNQFSDFTKNATRAEMVGIMRAALPDSSWNAINSVNALPDVNKVTPYSEDIFLMYNAGVITGSDMYGLFQPYAYITRAEVATIVTRMADSSYRKTLSLTPVTARNAPVLSGFGKKISKMSCGRLPVVDSQTNKWGFVDTNGTMVIPAVYDEVTAFTKTGYAIVRKDKQYGTIDVNGNTLVPLSTTEFDNHTRITYELDAYKNNGALIIDGKPVTPFKSAYGYDYLYTQDGISYFRSYVKDSGYGLVTSKGKTIVPAEYDGIVCNGYYVFGIKDEEANFDIYSISGEKIKSENYNISPYAELGNPLVKWVDGSKYGVASIEGKITEAIYDEVVLCDNSDFAIVKYGDMTGLVGINGLIFDLGEYNVKDAYGKYAMLRTQENEVFFTDASKNFTNKVRYAPSEYDSIFTITDDVIHYSTGNYYIYEFESGETYKTLASSIVEWEKGILLYNGKYYKEHGNVDGYHYYKTPDGLYGIYDYHKGNITEAKYTTAEAALEAYKATFACYYISEENGKPIVVYDYDGNLYANKGEEEIVIRYYKNKIYYDEIVDLGEGYFACRINETWYLVCA